MQSESLYDKSQDQSQGQSQERDSNNKTINRRRKWLIGCRACRSSVHMDCKTIVHTVLIDPLQSAAGVYKILRKKATRVKENKGKKRLD